MGQIPGIVAETLGKPPQSPFWPPPIMETQEGKKNISGEMLLAPLTVFASFNFIGN